MSTSHFKVGDIVRYAAGPTALFRLASFCDGRWHGEHCMGGPHDADEKELRPVSEKDRQEWGRQKIWRRR